MLFSSTVFLYLFLPLTLLLYYAFSFSVVLKNGVLLLASLYFYYYGEPVFVRIMLLSIVLNYIFGLWIGYSKQKENSKKSVIPITCGVICNLGLLFVYKYLTFTLKNLEHIVNLPFAIPNIVLPIGISFFTFQSMSYLIDVYRGNAKVQKNPFDLALYIALFPQLIAGPIVRYETVAEQIRSRKETWSSFYTGACRFLVGLFKKILISNQMGLVADKAFSMNTNGELGTAMAWLGAFAYALQIYYDFSGYSDMAIGLGKLFGFTFEENFNYPYISTSITEFWRRWHISLGTWFRDYLYIPLGGSRVSTKARLTLNLAVVWIATGIWHGAAWNFLLWGVWFFVLLTVEKFVFSKQIRSSDSRLFYQKIPAWLYAMLAVLFGWVLFRATNLSEAARYLGVMFGIGAVAETDHTALLFLGQKTVYFVSAILFSTPLLPKIREMLDTMRKKSSTAVIAIACDAVYPVIMLVLLLVCTAYLLKTNYNPFIYFNF